MWHLTTTYRIFAYTRRVLYKDLRTPHPGCVLYMGASYVKYFLHKSPKPASYIRVHLIFGCILYAQKYGRIFAYIRLVLYKDLRTPHPGYVLYMGASYVKYFLHKSLKPVSYIRVRLICAKIWYPSTILIFRYLPL